MRGLCAREGAVRVAPAGRRSVGGAARSMAVERGMAERAAPTRGMDDVDAVTRAVLTASRLLVAVSARSLARWRSG